MKLFRLLALLCFASAAGSQTYYNKTTVPPTWSDNHYFNILGTTGSIANLFSVTDGANWCSSSAVGACWLQGHLSTTTATLGQTAGTFLTQSLAGSSPTALGSFVLVNSASGGGFAAYHEVQLDNVTNPNGAGLEVDCKNRSLINAISIPSMIVRGCKTVQIVASSQGLYGGTATNPAMFGALFAGNWTTDAILTGSITNASSGLTPGTYTNIPLTCVSGTCSSNTYGSYATATITVGGGGTVTTVDFTGNGNSPGDNYSINDILSAAGSAIGGAGSTSTFQYTVSTEGVSHQNATFNTGILFSENSLTNTAYGYNAIAMPLNYAVEWWSAGNVQFAITSNSSTAGQGGRLNFADNSLNLFTPGLTNFTIKMTNVMASGDTTGNYMQVQNALSGANPRITCTGPSDTDVGCAFTAKGAGNFVFTGTGASTLTGTPITNLFASPPAIGGSSAAAGNFTTLGATGLLTASNGATINGAAISLNASSNFNTVIGTGTTTGTVSIGNTAGTGSAVTISAPVTLGLGTSVSKATWGTAGVGWIIPTATFNDTTAGSGTVADDAAYGIAAPTFTNTQGTANTLTNATTLFVSAPLCTTGASNWSACTSKFAIKSNGNIFTTALLQAQGGLTITGAAISLNNNSNFTVGVGIGSNTQTVTIGGGSNAVTINSTTLTLGGSTLITSSSPFTNSNAAFKLTGITTGTNADTVCLKADGTLLIQAAACTISSLRFKKEVTDVQTSTLPQISDMRVASFRRKGGELNRDPNGASRQVGLIAENIAKAAPECALYEDDMKTPKSYRQECVIALLVKGEQELLKQNTMLKARLSKLEVRHP